MPNDQIKAAARRRMAQTGEPYAAARRAVISEHHDRPGETGSPGEHYKLSMSGEIRDWLAALRDSDPAAARTVVRAVTALMNEGALLGEPLVAATADFWPSALAEGLERSYLEQLERLTAMRWGLSHATDLVRAAQKRAAELESAGTEAAARQAGTTRQLLAKLIVHERLLMADTRQLDTDVSAFRIQREVLMTSYKTSRLILLLQEDKTSTTEVTRLRHVTAQMERELGQEPGPPALMELRPAGPDDAGLRVLFAVEPADTVLLIAVLDGPEAVQGLYLKAILLSADRLRQVRAGQAPDAVAHGYESARPFLAEFYPDDAGDGSRDQPAEPQPGRT